MRGQRNGKLVKIRHFSILSCSYRSGICGGDPAADAHRTIANADPTLRGFAAQVDTMHPDLWLDEPTLQIISLTSNGVGGPNQAETAINIRKINGQPAGTKGVRPTLVLAGDVNLDGKVNALDLQESIAQLGTNPQATGVMPIADLNEDSIIDLLDVALLLDGYGGETDIYEGLWDGSRLLAVVGGSAGFGSIGGGSIGGNWGLEPGRRPIDGCLRSMPDDGGQGLVPALLRQDGQINCNDCPACGLPDPLDCFKCSGPGRIEGGQITATPDQPMLGDTVVFSWDNFIVTGRSDQCGPPCNGNQACDLADYVLQGDKWYIDKKDPTSGQWIVPPYKRSHDINGVRTNDQPTVIGEACGEYRFRLESGVVGPRDSCPGLPSVTKEKEVQFADFKVSIQNQVATSAGSNRTTVGLLEKTDLVIVGGSSVEWRLNGRVIGTYSGVTFDAPLTAGTFTVSAVGQNGCQRDIVFNVIEPSSVRLIEFGEIHTKGLANAGFCGLVEVLPTSVSFIGVFIREGEDYADGTGSFAHLDFILHETGSPVMVGSNNLFYYDRVLTTARPNYAGEYVPGVFLWDIPVEYFAGRDAAGQDVFVEFTTAVHRATVDSSGRVKTTKEGSSSEFDVDNDSVNCP
tara:strand:- start:27479 stop:29365 length:1887 start_codon:yes stop_codon:yes gene_type:complete